MLADEAVLLEAVGLRPWRLDHEHADARTPGITPWTPDLPEGARTVWISNTGPAGAIAFVRTDGVPAALGRGSLPLMPGERLLLGLNGGLSIIGGGYVDVHPVVDVRPVAPAEGPARRR